MLPLRLAALDGRHKHVAAAVCCDELNPPFPHTVGRMAPAGSWKIRAKLVGDRCGERSEYFSHSDPKSPRISRAMQLPFGSRCYGSVSVEGQESDSNPDDRCFPLI